MGVSFKVIEKDLGWSKILKAAKELAKAKPYVKVGVLGNAKKRDDGASNVEIALIQEFGSPKNNIPSRSFIRAPFHAKRKEYIDMLRKLLSHTLSKNAMDGKTALKIMGERIAADFKKSAPGTPPPNAPSTLAAKLRKTRKGSQGTPKTLVDTGKLVDSISYEVVG